MVGTWGEQWRWKILFETNLALKGYRVFGKCVKTRSAHNGVLISNRSFPSEPERLCFGNIIRILAESSTNCPNDQSGN